MRFNLIAAAALLCASGAAQAQTRQLVTDMKLEDAGFTMRHAETPDQLRRIQMLPAHKFVARVKDGKRYYLYADAELCKCVFVGGPTALQTFRDMRGPQQPDSVAPSGNSAFYGVIEDLNEDRWNLLSARDDFFDYNY